MADWKHIHVTTHWYSHCFQSRPTPKITSTNVQLPCKKYAVGRDWWHRGWCDGRSCRAINPPYEYLLIWRRIGSTSWSLRIDIHIASNLALRPNHYVQKQKILLRHYALIFTLLPISPYARITMSKNKKYFYVTTHWYSHCSNLALHQNHLIQKQQTLPRHCCCINRLYMVYEHR